MRILIDARCLMNAQVSGVTIYAENIIRYLADLDEIKIIYLYCNSFKSPNLPKFDSEKINIIRSRIPNKILNVLLFFFDKPKLDKLVGIDFDVFFMPDLRPCALNKNIKSVLVVHDLSFLKLPRTFNLKTRLWHRILRPKDEIEKADRIISVSAFTRDQLQNELGINEEKIKLVYHGKMKSLKLSEMDRSKVLEKFGIEDDFVFSISTLEPRKNLVKLIESFKILKKDVRWKKLSLVIAGSENREIFSDNIELEAEDVIFLGNISEMEKQVLFEKASCFAYVSLYEGFGLPILEAMQFLCPIVTSRDSAMSEVCDGLASLVYPLDANDIAEKMDVILSSEDDYFKNKFKIRSDFFDWEKTAKKTFEVFKELIE